MMRGGMDGGGGKKKKKAFVPAVLKKGDGREGLTVAEKGKGGAEQEK